MAIVLDTYSAMPASDFSTTVGATNYTFSMTCSGQDRFAFLYIVAQGYDGPTGAVGVDTNAPPTYGGVAMTKLSSNATAASTNLNDELWYLVNPPVGTNDFFWTFGDVNFQSSDKQNIAAIGVNFTGVDPTAPLGSVGTTNVTSASNAASYVLSAPLTGATGEAFVDFCTFVSASTNEAGTVGAGQSLIYEVVNSANNALEFSVSQIAGAAAYTMERSITRVNSIVAVLTGVPLKPAPTGKSRALEYFFDIYSGRILDAYGNRVMPWEVKPNRWIRVSGHMLPSGRKYASYTQDPEVAYIEEVSYSDAGLSIKTNRGELTEVLFARAAGGKTL